MQQAIFTSYLSPTNTQGGRVKAYGKDKRQSITDAWDSGSSVEENHARVAKLLAAKLGWSGLYKTGHFADSGYAFVHVVSDGYAGNFAQHMAEVWRASEYKPFGIEGRDWFYLPNVDRG